MKWRGVLAALLIMVPAGCSRSYSAHYRTTVQVRTPQGVVAGAAVRTVWLGRSMPNPIPLPGEDRPHWEEHGEAVAVDLPSGQTLFALVGDPVEEGWLIRDEPAARSDEGFQLWPNTPVSPRWKTPYKLPLLVRFRDIGDPTSIERVDPNNLAASFGPGYSLKSIRVQKTYDAVTTGIDKRLSWLHGYPKWMSVGGPDFGANRFSTEAMK